MNPDDCPPVGHYGRMFPKAKEPITGADEQKLVKLGEAMCDLEKQEGTFVAPAGYTYFGQFIDHDLTRDRTPLEQRDIDPASIPNYRTAWLDLDNVYAGGPRQSPHLYEGAADEEVFKIRKTAGVLVPGNPPIQLPGGTLHDLPRDEDGVAIIGDGCDRRNLENLIVMQFQILMMKFHNEAIKQLRPPATIQDVESIGSGNLFEKARRLVKWQYQRLVHRDFLYRFLDENTVTNVRRNGPSFEWPSGDFFIPAEFSLAAFRFGHSLVRDSYSLNCHKVGVGLQDLFRQAHERAALPEDWVIEWGRFFRSSWLVRSGDAVPSRPIDTAIASELHNLPDSTIHRFSQNLFEPEPKQLPVRTLLRGARAHLPSGQEVAQVLIDKGLIRRGLSEAELTRDNREDCSGRVLRNVGLAANTPLFYYLLKEAEVSGRARQLGPIGSRIVAEVIEGALRHDRDSYLGKGFEEKLPQWRIAKGLAPVSSIFDLIRLLDNTVPQGCRPRNFAGWLQAHPWAPQFLSNLINLFRNLL